MFHVVESVEIYEGGFENIENMTPVECATYEEALEVYEQRIDAHIKAGRNEMFKTDRHACYADFNGGEYAVASYSLLIL